MIGEGGWNKKLMMWDFYDVQFEEYPGWEKVRNNEPAFVIMERICSKDKTSLELDTEFDDISEGQFYSRDWTKSGIQFCNDGETYWSGFWFQYKRDAEKFVELYGGKGNWMNGYDEYIKRFNEKRDLVYE